MTVPDPALPLDGQLCFGLYAASIAMGRLYKPLLDGWGITYPQYLVLNALWEEDGRTVGAIAHRLALESSTITPLVKRLETAGLVTRSRDPRDDRQVRVRLTGAGATLRRHCTRLAEAVLARTGFSAAGLADLTARVHDLRHALAEHDPS